MNCQDTVARLADPAARAEPELCSHLEGCADCRAALLALEALERTASLPAQDALDRFPARVRTAHLARRETHSRPLRTGLFAGALAAGALAAMLALMAVPRNGGSPSHPTAALANPTSELDDCLFGKEAADSFASDLIAGDEADDDDFS
jgi:hypothetical protein